MESSQRNRNPIKHQWENNRCSSADTHSQMYVSTTHPPTHLTRSDQNTRTNNFMGKRFQLKQLPVVVVPATLPLKLHSSSLVSTVNQARNVYLLISCKEAHGRRWCDTEAERERERATAVSYFPKDVYSANCDVTISSDMI